jgi:hypothetical protein
MANPLIIANRTQTCNRKLLRRSFASGQDVIRRQPGKGQINDFAQFDNGPRTVTAIHYFPEDLTMPPFRLINTYTPIPASA